MFVSFLFIIIIIFLIIIIIKRTGKAKLGCSQVLTRIVSDSNLVRVTS